MLDIRKEPHEIELPNRPNHCTIRKVDSIYEDVFEVEDEGISEINLTFDRALIIRLRIKKFRFFGSTFFIEQYNSRSFWTFWQLLSHFGFLENFGKNSKRWKINNLKYVMVEQDFRPF